MPLFLVLLLGACRYAAPPPSVPAPAFVPSPTPAKWTYAMLSEEGALPRYVPVQEAIQALGFTPVWPTVLLPNTNPMPQVPHVSVSKDRGPLVELRYLSPNSSTQDPKAFLIIIEEGPPSEALAEAFGIDPMLGYVNAMYWKTALISSVALRYNFNNKLPQFGGIISDFTTAWEYKELYYRLNIMWIGETPPGPETATKEQAALDIVAGLIASANGP